jgi:hypothetical protein
MSQTIGLTTLFFLVIPSGLTKDHLLVVHDQRGSPERAASFGCDEGSGDLFCRTIFHVYSFLLCRADLRTAQTPRPVSRTPGVAGRKKGRMTPRIFNMQIYDFRQRSLDFISDLSFPYPEIDGDE